MLDTGLDSSLNNCFGSEFDFDLESVLLILDPVSIGGSIFGSKIGSN